METTAGASDLAGFIEAPQIGPANIASKAITEPTTIPAVIPFSLAPVETPRITNIRIVVRRNSRTKDCQGEPGRQGHAEQDASWKQKAQNCAGDKGSCALTCDIWQHIATNKPPRKPKADRNSRINVGAGNVAKRVNHREDDESKRERDANMSDGATSDFVDDDRAGSRKNECKCPDKLSNEFLYHGRVAAQCSSQNLSI